MDIDYSYLSSFSISADARIQPISPEKLISWNIQLNKNSYPFSVNSNLNQKTISFDLVPILLQDGFPVEITNTSVERYLPNYLRIKFEPIHGIDALIEYLVPDCESIVIKMSARNASLDPVTFNFGWIANLIPGDSGEQLSKEYYSRVPYLMGQFDDSRVYILDQNPITDEVTTQPSLLTQFQLAPGQDETNYWITYLGEDYPYFVSGLFNRLSRSWEKEISRLKNLNSNIVSIKTGNPVWDLIFALSQQYQRSGLVNFRISENGKHLSSLSPESIFDLGYAIENSILTDPDLAEELFNRYLRRINDDGFLSLYLDTRVEKTRIPAPPILAALAWEVYSRTSNRQFLEQHLDNLIKLFEYWVPGLKNLSLDIIQDLQNYSQILLADYKDEFEDVNNLSIFELSNPAILAYLINEAKSLYKICVTINHIDRINHLTVLMNDINLNLMTHFDRSSSIFLYHDKYSRISNDPIVITQITTNQQNALDHILEEPSIIRLLAPKDIVGDISDATIFIKGENVNNLDRVERINGADFYQVNNMLIADSIEPYKRIDQVEVDSPTEFKMSLIIPGTSHPNATLFFPLYAKAMSPDDASTMVDTHLKNGSDFWGAYGISVIPSSSSKHRKVEISMQMNHILGMGLLRNNFHREAYDLANGILTGLEKNLISHGTLVGNYDPFTAECETPMVSLSSLPPNRFFLEAFGIEIINPHKVKITGVHHHDTDLHVEYRGLLIDKSKESTTVTFPSGTTTVVKSNETRTISLN